MPVLSVEANVLHAIIEGDGEHAVELLHELLPGELRDLRRSLKRTDAAVAGELADRG
ncbi:MAG: hypothetical protein ACR2M5_11605 [Nakamurella sp.]